MSRTVEIELGDSETLRLKDSPVVGVSDTRIGRLNLLIKNDLIVQCQLLK